jgi:uncharacterized membrane protein YuzA (DUF378 family)
MEITGCIREKPRVKLLLSYEKEEVDMLDRFALTLNIIGGLNWGLIGLFQFDLVAWLFGGSGSGLSRVVYTLVGLSALWCISLLFRDRDTEIHHEAAGA